MANVLLVSYAGYPYTPSSLCPDNGLAALASVLMEAGHAVRILDYGTVETMRRLYPEDLARRAAPALADLASQLPSPSRSLLSELAQIEAALDEHQARELQAIGAEVIATVEDIEPAFVGFKLWNGDGFTGSVSIAQRIRRSYPKLTLYAGGPHATWCGPVIYEYTDVFDAVVLGEGEDRILALVDYALGRGRLDDIPGIVRSSSDRAHPPATVDLSATPQPTYHPDVYPAMVGDQKLKLFVLDDSRGCPYRCAFCTHPFESGSRLRTRPASRIVDDMQHIISQHGIAAFRLAGSSTPGSLMAEVAEEILARGLRVQYTTFAHFASSAPDHFDLMRSSGLFAMFFGLETGSQELLRRAAGKPIALERVRQTVVAARRAGIAVACSMIVPMPFETEETMQESLQLLLQLRPDSVPVQFPGLLPGTEWFEHPDRYGFEVDREQYMRENLSYKIKLLFPPTFWKPLPYKLNGMPFNQFAALTGKFIAALEAQGILTNVPDDNMLMAHLAGMSPRQFRDAARLWCAAGDAAAVADFVRRFNAAASSIGKGETP